MHPKIYNFISKQIKDTGKWIKFSKFAGYVADDGEPIKCYKCGSKNIKTIPKEYINYIVCEESAVCKNCGTQVGYWAYGYWQP
jgi:hypothetical protein